MRTISYEEVDELDEWYEPKDLRFTKRQVREFILPWLPLFRSGDWPDQPSGYSDSQGRKVRTSGPFTTPVEVAIEMDSRLDLCRHEGHLLIRYYTYGHKLENIAQSLRRSEQWTERRLGSLLRFVSGWKRARVTYQEWTRNGWVKDPSKSARLLKRDIGLDKAKMGVL